MPVESPDRHWPCDGAALFYCGCGAKLVWEYDRRGFDEKSGAPKYKRWPRCPTLKRVKFGFWRYLFSGHTYAPQISQDPIGWTIPADLPLSPPAEVH